MLRSTELRQTACRLYEWYFEWTGICLGLETVAPDSETARAIAQLLIAASDGLALQRLLNPEAFPAETPHAVLEAILRKVLSGEWSLAS